jgi:hypothetical protein
MVMDDPAASVVVVSVEARVMVPAATEAILNGPGFAVLFVVMDIPAANPSVTNWLAESVSVPATVELDAVNPIVDAVYVCVEKIFTDI